MMPNQLFNMADNAGRAAAEACVPTPMIVCDGSYTYAPILDGVCGFAWVNIKPGTSKFARWLTKNNLARRDSYYGGVTVWISGYGQSMARKEAYAHAFANVLRENGIQAIAMSRMD